MFTLEMSSLTWCENSDPSHGWTWLLGEVQDLFICFLRLHLQHLEVPRLGVRLELQLPTYTTATAMWDPTVSVTDASWILVGFLTCWATRGTSKTHSFIKIKTWVGKKMTNKMFEWLRGSGRDGTTFFQQLNRITTVFIPFLLSFVSKICI